MGGQPGQPTSWQTGMKCWGKYVTASERENASLPVGGQKQVSMQIVTLSSTVKVMVATKTRLPPGNRWSGVPVGT